MFLLLWYVYVWLIFFYCAFIPTCDMRAGLIPTVFKYLTNCTSWHSHLKLNLNSYDNNYKVGADPSNIVSERANKGKMLMNFSLTNHMSPKIIKTKLLISFAPNLVKIIYAKFSEEEYIWIIIYTVYIINSYIQQYSCYFSHMIIYRRADHKGNPC